MNNSDNRKETGKSHKGLPSRKFAFRFSRDYQFTSEFLTHQLRFDFAVVTDAVLEVLVNGKKKLREMYRTWLKNFKSQTHAKTAIQLKLNFKARLEVARIEIAA